MSANKLINAVIAMVEDRPQDAREMLRSPEMKSIPLGEVHSRLSKSLRDREIKAQITHPKTGLRVCSTHQRDRSNGTPQRSRA